MARLNSSKRIKQI